MILIAGGDTDPHLRRVVERAERAGLEHRPLLVGRGSNPGLYWDLPGDRLYVDGEPLAPSAVFLRYDVFTSLEDGRPQSAERARAWYVAVLGWALAHPRVRLLNRRTALLQPNKPLMLERARRAGLAVPPTAVANDLALLESAVAGPAIAKSVTDGAYTEPLEEALERAGARDGRTAVPAVVQPRLVAPEVRVFVVGGRFHAFRLVSGELDYRTDPEVEVEPLDHLPAGVEAGLGRLVRELGADFGAADFKASPESGELLFLELNSMPMFAAFDRAADGALVDSMLRFLAGG